MFLLYSAANDREEKYNADVLAERKPEEDPTDSITAEKLCDKAQNRIGNKVKR